MFHAVTNKTRIALFMTEVGGTSFLRGLHARSLYRYTVYKPDARLKQIAWKSLLKEMHRFLYRTKEENCVGGELYMGEQGCTVELPIGELSHRRTCRSRRLRTRQVHFSWTLCQLAGFKPFSSALIKTTETSQNRSANRTPVQALRNRVPARCNWHVDLANSRTRWQDVQYTPCLH